MGLLDYVHKTVRVVQDVAAAAKVISQAAPAVQSAMKDVEQAANLLRGSAIGMSSASGPSYPPEVLHASGVLGLSLPATRADVESAYKLAALRAHPDITHGDNAAMVRVNKAKKTMLDYLNPVSNGQR
jgi:hypothetical protein